MNSLQEHKICSIQDWDIHGVLVSNATCNNHDMDGGLLAFKVDISVWVVGAYGNNRFSFLFFQ